MYIVLNPLEQKVLNRSLAQIIKSGIYSTIVDDKEKGSMKWPGQSSRPRVESGNSGKLPLWNNKRMMLREKPGRSKGPQYCRTWCFLGSLKVNPEGHVRSVVHLNRTEQIHGQIFGEHIRRTNCGKQCSV